MRCMASVNTTPDHLAQDGVAELEIDEEPHLAATLRAVGELPAAVQMAERPVQILGVDALFGGKQRDAAAEAFAEHLEADDQIGLDHLGAVGAGLA